MINEGINRAHRNFDAYLEEHVNLNWEEQRRKVYEHFGLTHRTSENVSDGGVSYPDLSSKGGFGKSSRRGKDNTGTPRAVHSRSIFGQSAVNKSVIGTPGVGAGNAQLFGEASEKATPAPVVSEDRLLREKQVKFAEKVQKLNEARLQETNYRLLQEFASVEGHPIGEVCTRYPRDSQGMFSLTIT